jgi:hypothetical protein
MNKPLNISQLKIKNVVSDIGYYLNFPHFCSEAGEQLSSGGMPRFF